MNDITLTKEQIIIMNDHLDLCDEFVIDSNGKILAVCSDGYVEIKPKDSNMEKDYSEYNNHSCYEVLVTYSDACNLLENFTTDVLKIKTDDLRFINNQDDKGGMRVIGYVTGENVREVGKIIHKNNVPNCAVMVKKYCSTRFTKHMESNKIEFKELED